MFTVPEAVLIISISAMLIAQVSKFFIDGLINKKLNESILISTGGMPSSHSALVTALFVSIGMFDYHNQGTLSIGFAISFVIALVVIHDSMGIRLEASKHAMELNIIKYRLNMIENIDIEEKKLKEKLGHKPKEVLVGILLGAFIGVIGFFIFK
ncbi:divergent PAP2 family protein [Acholeplasma laidlawii]|uniref:divergent PAP2 family protein n=1 Tax=Acholeplasma laidlawii TaxID=2148 RepID=UPI0018C1D52E|nr:divergent PAP2 family protein [Acholeplasma laidlawii]MBG0762331.1 divergent PAP2 family protein [Acholeplasma laidlawii]